MRRIPQRMPVTTGSLNYGNLRVPSQGPPARNNPYAAALQAIAMQDAPPAAAGMMSPIAPPGPAQPAAPQDPFDAIRQALPLNDNDRRPGGGSGASHDPTMMSPMIAGAPPAQAQPPIPAIAGGPMSPGNVPPGAPALNPAMQSQYGNPNDPLMQSPGGGPAVTPTPPLAGLSRGGPPPGQSPMMRPITPGAPGLTQPGAPAPNVAGSPPGSSSSSVAAMGAPAGAVQRSAGAPGRPGFDPRNDRAPNITPTSNDPNDRAPENTAGREDGDSGGMLGLSPDIWAAIMEAGLATMVAGGEGQSTLSAIGSGGLQGMRGYRDRQQAEQEDERQTTLEDRQYEMDRQMADLSAEEARRPQYQMVQDASGNLVAINTRDPSQTVPTGVRQRVPGSGGGRRGLTANQEREAANDLMDDARERGIEMTYSQAIDQIRQVDGGGAPAAGGGAAGGPPTPDDIAMLQDDDTPEMRAYFDEAFGAGAAAQVLGGG